MSGGVLRNEDFIFLNQLDKRIAQEELGHAIASARIYVAEENKKIAGWLRYNLFWDEIPFMNMLYILEERRKKGHGKKIAHKRIITINGFWRCVYKNGVGDNIVGCCE